MAVTAVLVGNDGDKGLNRMAQEHEGLTRLHRTKIEGLMSKTSFEEAA